MFREINMKFRAYNKTTEQFLDQTYVSINGGGDIVTYDWHSDHGRSWGSPYDDIIIQYAIGMQDKNGVDIYEGDIVEYFYIQDKFFDSRPKTKTRNTVTRYSGHSLEETSSGGPDQCDSFEDIEIVGNIFDEN